MSFLKTVTTAIADCTALVDEEIDHLPDRAHKTAFLAHTIYELCECLYNALPARRPFSELPKPAQLPYARSLNYTINTVTDLSNVGQLAAFANLVYTLVLELQHYRGQEPCQNPLYQIGVPGSPDAASPAAPPSVPAAEKIATPAPPPAASGSTATTSSSNAGSPAAPDL
jgi:hypothetical protein